METEEGGKGQETKGKLLDDRLLSQNVDEMPDPTYEQLIRDVEQIILELEPDGDIRELPDNHRRRTFLAGWRDATERGRNYQATVLKELTWMNLGWRLGKKYGPRSRDEITTLYEILAEHYRQNQATRENRFVWNDGDVEIFRPEE